MHGDHKGGKKLALTQTSWSKCYGLYLVTLEHSTETQNKWSQTNFSQRGIAKVGNPELDKSDRPALKSERLVEERKIYGSSFLRASPHSKFRNTSEMALTCPIFSDVSTCCFPDNFMHMWYGAVTSLNSRGRYDEISPFRAPRSSPRRSRRTASGRLSLKNGPREKATSPLAHIGMQVPSCCFRAPSGVPLTHLPPVSAVTLAARTEPSDFGCSIWPGNFGEIVNLRSS